MTQMKRVTGQSESDFPSADGENAENGTLLVRMTRSPMQKI